METTVKIPAKDKVQKVDYFIFSPGSKEVTAVILTDGVRSKIQFNVQPLLDGVTATKKNTIRQWYKRLGILAINTLNSADGVVIVDTDLTGEAFDDV